MCIRRRGAIFENVVPPLVVVADDGHVIGHDVENLAEIVGLQRGTECRKVRLGADLRIDLAVIDYVVAVLASRPSP